MKARYFDIKKDITIEEIADILQNAWPNGIINRQFVQLKPKTKRHFITKNRSVNCEKCGSYLLVDDTCFNKHCKDYWKEPINKKAIETNRLKEIETFNPVPYTPDNQGMESVEGGEWVKLSDVQTIMLSVETTTL